MIDLGVQAAAIKANITRFVGRMNPPNPRASRGRIARGKGVNARAAGAMNLWQDLFLPECVGGCQ